MSNTLEQLADDKVRLTVEVPAHDVHHAVEHAANDLATSAKIPGFRKGKVPMPLLLQRIGKERLFAEAVESHIGGWFWNAATRARVNPVAQPEYEYELPAADDQDWSFSATVAVQPKPEPADWTTLEVPKHEAEVPQTAVDAELEALQRTVGELVPVEGRPAQEGDTVVIDLIAADGSAQRDYVIELGSERLVEEIENAIRGLVAGETARGRLRARRRRPPQRDRRRSRRSRSACCRRSTTSWRRQATEFDTLDELRAEIEGRLRGADRGRARRPVPRRRGRRARQGVEGQRGGPARRGCARASF